MPANLTTFLVLLTPSHLVRHPRLQRSDGFSVTLFGQSNRRWRKFYPFLIVAVALRAGLGFTRITRGMHGVPISFKFSRLHDLLELHLAELKFTRESTGCLKYLLLAY